MGRAGMGCGCRGQGTPVLLSSSVVPGNEAWNAGLGVDPVTVSAWISIASQFASLFGPGKEPKRLAANEYAYRMAVSGDPLALEFLRQRTGQAGILSAEAAAPIWRRLWPADPGDIGWGGALGGWATDSAKSDAQTKFQDVVARLTNPPPASPPPTYPPTNPPTYPPAGPPYPPPPMDPSLPVGTDVTVPLLVGGGLLLLMAMSGRGGRR